MWLHFRSVPLFDKYLIQYTKQAAAVWFDYLSCALQQEMLGSGWSCWELLVVCTRGEKVQMVSKTAEWSWRATPCGNVRPRVSRFGSGKELRKLKAE